MNAAYQELAERIRGEVVDLERVVQRTLRVWSQAQKILDDQNVYLDSVALNLHGWYTGIERLFELTARHVDRTVPTGEMWHRELLQQMAREIPDVRPAVIDPDIAKALDEFRRFRHLVRNVYTTNLVPDRMANLMLNLPAVWSQLRAELIAFADFLDELASVA